MKRIVIALLVTVVGAGVTCGSVWAQATAQITGTVRDQSGAVLPGVEVTATQTETGIARMTVTNETGSYILPNLPLGPYRFEAALPGFRTFVQTGIVLQVNSNPVINPILEIGQVSEQVEVQANAALVETRNTAVGAVIEQERILELPLEGRRVTDLITLAGAATQGAAGSVPGGFIRGTSGAATLVSIAGGLQFGVMYALDGAIHNNAYDGSQMPFPFPDALQEFKVETSGSGAAGGSRGSGGQVNAVTKSGTNEYHGNLFEFVRNYKFNARNFFAAQRDNLKRNQFGGTLGGPIVKNKLFFFGGYQGTITRSSGGDTIAYVPTAATLAGDWTTFASPGCNAGKTTNLLAPFTGNRIDPALYSRAALNIAARLPAAQDACGKVTYSIPQNPNEFQIVGKGDYQLTQNHSIFGRYMVTSYTSPHPYELTKNLLTLTSDSGGNDDFAQSYALGSTYLINPNTVNAFRIAVNRTVIGRPGTKYFSPGDVGVNAFSYAEGAMVLNITGGFLFSTRTVFAHNVTNTYQINDDVSLVHGNHQLTFGANLANYRIYQRCLVSGQGLYVFNGNATGMGWGDFMTGKLTSLMQLTPVQWSSRQAYVATYLQDVWKISSKLTVNGGLRWEPFLPLQIGYGQGASLNEGVSFNFSDERFTKGIRSTVYPNAPAGLYFPGDPGFPKHGPTNPRWTYLSPRVGLAWDVSGDGRTSLRASYGIAYDFSGAASYGGSSSAPPWGFNTTVNSPAGGFENPWSTFPGGNPFPYTRLSRFPNNSDYYFVQKHDSSSPRVHTWSLSLQRQIPASFLLSASYLGNQAFHTWVGGAVNRAVFFPGNAVNGVCTTQGFTIQVASGACSTTANTNARRRLTLQDPVQGQLYGNLFTREDVGTQHYHGMLLSVQRRAGSGVNVGANYTWSHCIGIDPNANGTGRGDAGYLDPNDRSFDYGNCQNSDRRQVFNMTAVAPTPQFANTTARLLGSGWQLSGIYRWQTGRFYTITTGLDRLLSGQAGNQRPVQVLENPYGDRHSLTNYLNPAAFVQPALGTMGNMRPFNVEGPGYWQLDIGLSRSFQFRESQKLEFRAEAFNVTNSFRPGNVANTTPNTTLNNNTFGQITSSADARIMQFALKYAF
jgi:hypothetical protein